jgi:hypothetical protein
MYINGAGLNFATQPGGIGLTEYYRRIAEGFPKLKANQLAYEMDTYDITPEDLLNAFQMFGVQASSNDILDAYERGGGRKFLTTGEQERYAREAAARDTAAAEAAARDAAAAAAQERVRLAAEADARNAAAAATKAAQDAAAAAAKVAADAAAAVAAADAARAKAALDLKYSFLDPSIADKSPEDKAAYFNFLKSKNYSESLIFEAIAYWIGPQSPEDIAALKTLADELAKPVLPKLPPIVEPPPKTIVFGQQPTGGNTGLLLAAGLAALTLLG